MSQQITIENKTNHTYVIDKNIINPHSLVSLKLNYSANRNVEYFLCKLNSTRKLRFELNINGKIQNKSHRLYLNNNDFYININKSTGTGTGYCWNTETDVSPIYTKKNVRLVIC